VRVLVLLGIAFLAGVITALSPCVLPVLPLLLAGSAASESRWRPFAVMAGLVVSFTTFTLAGAALLSALGLPEDLLRTLAIVMLLVLAASLLSQRVSRILGRPFLFLTRRPVARESSGFVVGVSAGLVMVPCAGPVLAAVAALAATGEVTWRVVLVTTAYAIGHALPLLAVAIGGQRLTSGMRVVRTHAHVLRQGAGVVVGLTAIAIALNAPERLATAVPGYTQAFQEEIERSSSAQRELAKLSGGDVPVPATRDAGAPEVEGIEGWINTPDSEPLTLASLRGRVVLVDFWTYSCINCLRTLPHLKAWDASYRDAGLTIIGVHSPEFAFERVPDNVRDAVKRLGIRYPVALDNDFATWQAYSNQYWPAKYLIDRDGRVRFHHFGEGAYEDTERRIRRLLGETVTTRPTSVDDDTPITLRTPESYLGYERLARFANGSVAPDVEWTYTLPPGPLPPDVLGLGGRWKVEGERIVAGEDARLELRFQAKDIFLVLEGEGAVDVLVDGRPVRTVTVAGLPRLYTLARFPQFRRGLLELRFSPGVAGYAFTFG
jgi:cytochrome c biogenesis protein CcdA/thiol-disulfide isomerase/thioredoxin